MSGSGCRKLIDSRSCDCAAFSLQKDLSISNLIVKTGTGLAVGVVVSALLFRSGSLRCGGWAITDSILCRASVACLAWNWDRNWASYVRVGARSQLISLWFADKAQKKQR